MPIMTEINMIFGFFVGSFTGSGQDMTASEYVYQCIMSSNQSEGTVITLKLFFIPP